MIEKPPGIKEYEEFMAGCSTGVQRLIQQAKAGVFEEIEKTYMRGGTHPRLDGVIISTPRMITINEDEWQSLKSKYLKEEHGRFNKPRGIDLLCPRVRH